jgi:hypothetical protein
MSSGKARRLNSFLRITKLATDYRQTLLGLPLTLCSDLIDPRVRESPMPSNLRCSFFVVSEHIVFLILD